VGTEVVREQLLLPKGKELTTPEVTEMDPAEAYRTWLDEVGGDNTKQSNPKDIIGSDKVPMGLMPDSAIIAGNMAFLEGALKYGRYNWRIAGVRASIYKDAMDRHKSAWWNGEDIDPDSDLDHLFKMLACVSILIDAKICGKLIDDRPPRAPVAGMLRRFGDMVKKVKDRYADRKPHQYTIADSEISAEQVAV
jgi:hypothetical protein